MRRNCLNCARKRPFFDGDTLTGQVCGLDPEMRVNGRMHCEEWAYDGPPAVNLSSIGHIKYTINGKGKGHRK